LKPTAVIPVAGEGTRLRPHTYSRPKVLLEVAGRPMLAHILDKLVEQGVKDVVFIVGFRGQDVGDFVKREYDFYSVYVDQPERKGLGHAIYLARDHVKPGPVLVVLGDTIFRADLSRVIDGGMSRIAVMETDDPRRFGIVELEGERVVGVVEKPADPPSNLAVIGIYYIRDSKVLFDCLDYVVRNDIKTKGEYQLTDALAVMVERGEPLGVFLVDGWYDCGKVETLLRANRDLLELEPGGGAGEGTAIIPPVAIHPDAEVRASIVGPHVSIAGGVIVERSVIRDSIISSGTEIRDSVLVSSVIGRNCRVRGSVGSLNIGDESGADGAVTQRERSGG